MLPESTSPPRIYTHPFKNYVRHSQNLALPPRIYHPPLLFNNYDIMRRSQNLPLPPRIYLPLFNNYMRHSHNLPLHPRYTPLFNNCMRPSQNPSIPPSENLPPPFNKCICTTLPEYLSLFKNYMRHSHNLPFPLRRYHPSQQISKGGRVYSRRKR